MMMEGRGGRGEVRERRHRKKELKIGIPNSLPNKANPSVTSFRLIIFDSPHIQPHGYYASLLASFLPPT